MKVLKEGPGWSIEKNCTGKGNGGGGCGALLAVEREDIFLTSDGDYTGCAEYFFTFKCPCCDVMTNLTNDEVPSIVQRALYNERLMRLRR